MVLLKQDIFWRYLCHAPIPLAIERSVESRIYRHRPIKPPVLDVGCGDGVFARMVFAATLDTGVDADHAEIDRARQSRCYRELIHTTADRIPKADGSFNTILSNSVLEHIPDLKPVLHEIHRLLARGGRFYVTVPSQYFETYSLVAQVLTALRLTNLAGSYCRFYNRFWKQYHCYSLDHWIALARECNFTATEAFTFHPRLTCLVDDILAPFAMAGVFIKKKSGRWVLSPALRARWMPPVHALFRSLVARSGRCKNGGLVFMALEKT